MNSNSLRAIGQNFLNAIKLKNINLKSLIGTHTGKSNSELFLMDKLRERIPNVKGKRLKKLNQVFNINFYLFFLNPSLTRRR